MAEEENKNEETTPPVLKTMGDYLTRDKERAALKLILIPQYISELEADARLRDYFKDYNPASVTAFIKHYATLKAEWMTDDTQYAEWNESYALHWETEAMQRLQEIQQKKLFDIQCQWRAEKMELPDVFITSDFNSWGYVNILNCPFLPPITEEEVDLYILYMRSGNFEDEQELFSGGWQDYEGIKEAYQTENENRNFPEWYDFYNGRKGAGVYMLLPDLRGPKEEEYIQLAREEYHRNIKAKLDAVADKRPGIFGFPDTQTPFIVSTFEDKQTQAFYKLYKEDRFAIENNEDDDEYDDDDDDMPDDDIGFDIDSIMHDLERAPETIPVKANPDFREALKEAWDKYYIEKTAEAMPLAYEQYMLRIQTGLAFEVSNMESWKSVLDLHRNTILRGRELKGEPRNFDF